MMVRDFPTNQLFLCDGMMATNNAQYVEVKSTTKTFPDKFSKKAMNIAYILPSLFQPTEEGREKRDRLY